MFKGKNNKSWPQLPPELVRHIAMFYLMDVSYTSYMPDTWEHPHNWQQRLVFATLRDANDLEYRVMKICPEWAMAMQNHVFWQKATVVLDPLDIMAPYAVYQPKLPSLNSSAPVPAPIRLTAFQHFKNIINCSCLVCRVNAPNSKIGLMKRKHIYYTHWLRQIGVCAEHGERAAAFCGLCLRDAPLVQQEFAPHSQMVAVAENDDKETFPNVYATCRNCRGEFLLKRVQNNPRDREAIGGREMNSDDWETRNAVDTFIESGEGTVKEVLAVSRERLWLKNNTRLRDMLDQALAANRFNDQYEGNVPDDEDEEEDEEVLYMQMEEDGVRDLALGDWARLRIIDGHWISPADVFYDHFSPSKSPITRAIHPCPWTKDLSLQGSPVSIGDEERQEEEHPRPSVVKGEVPPTYSLCEQSLVMHRKQLRLILLPAMKNLVRKIVIEAATPCYGGMVEDPVKKVNKMTLDDVLKQLREEDGLWFNGIDWAERRLNSFKEQEQRERNSSRCRGDAGDDASTGSSGASSRSPTDTSPVLSTSTLQTTPSPPPSHGDDSDSKKEESSESTPFLHMPRVVAPPAIAVGPVLDPPKLLHDIPYIPETATHFPPYTKDDVMLVWREACSPLYHCRCKICLRSVALENAANGNKLAQQQIVDLAAGQGQPQAPVPRRTDDVVRLEEVTEIDVDGEGEVEMEYMSGDEICAEIDAAATAEGGYSSSDEDLDTYDIDEWYRYQLSTKQTLPALPSRARKRSCDEIETETGLTTVEEVEDRRTCTPPKRPRMEETRGASQITLTPNRTVGKHGLVTPTSPFTEATPSPCRQRKRSSEELEDFGEERLSAKKFKVLPAPVALTSMLADQDSTLSASPPPSSELSRPSSESA